MPVLVGNSHEGRVAAGDSLLEAATTHDTSWLKARLTHFAAAHRALVKSQQALDAAERALGSRRATVAERDVNQDDAVDGVAAAEKAAKAVTTALDAVGPALKATDGARSRRDALVQPWETAFAALKRGARAASSRLSKPRGAPAAPRARAPRTRGRSGSAARCP